MLSFGQLFGSNFWSSFKQQPSESIENLLKQPECKLEELLDDGDLLQECKNGNKNLIKYLDREKVKQLIDLITVMPETDEHNRGHKYPFVANEVFNCDMQQILDKFFISPADDVPEEEPDEQAEAEDGNKSDQGYEKDHDDSGSDSEEGDFTNEGEEEDHDQKDTTTKDDESPEETHSEEKDNTSTEDKDQKEESAEETPKDEEKKDSENESSSPSTEAAAQPEDTKEEGKEADKEESAPKDSQEAASPPTTVEKDDEKKAEETPEKEEGSTETSAEAPKSGTEEEEEKTDDASTHVSEAQSETVTAEPLSTNKYELLDYLNQFIDTEDVLNDVLSGYFARLLAVLIQKKSDEIATYYFKNEELLYRFAYHSYSKSITDTIIKILDIPNTKIELEEQEVTRVRKEFIRRLLGRLGDHESTECFEYSLNIFQIFNELTFKKAYYPLLIEQEFTNTLKEILLNPQTPECNANASIRILNVLISHLRNEISASNNVQTTPHTFMDDNDEVVLEDNDSKDQEQSQSVEEQLTNHPLVEFFKSQVINHLVSELDKEPETKHIDFQYGESQPVLGKKRLACINLLESLVELDEQSLRERILETDFYKKLFDLFLQFKNNTFLHLHLDNIFNRILKDSNTSTDKKVAFLEKLGIFDKLPEFWSENKAFVFPSQREFRHGYLAFTTRFANILRDLSSQSDQSMTVEVGNDKPEEQTPVEEVKASPLQQKLDKVSLLLNNLYSNRGLTSLPMTLKCTMSSMQLI